MPYRWTILQLQQLLEAVRCAAASYRPESRVLPTQALLSLLLRITNPASSDKGASDQSLVPENWRPCDFDRLSMLCNLFDHPPRSGFVDVVDFLVHIGLLHSPLGWPTLDVLMNVRKSVEAMAPSGAEYPDFWISLDQFEKLPLFPDPKDSEAQLWRGALPDCAMQPGYFDRSAAQRKWLGSVFQTFPAELRPDEAFNLDTAWYEYHSRARQEIERQTATLDDVKSEASMTPHVGPDGLPMVDAAAMDPGSMPVGLGQDAEMSGEDGARDGPPLPTIPPVPVREPGAIPPKPPKAISVRQFMTYLALGGSAEEGLHRALTLLGPIDIVDHGILPEDFHGALLQLGGRPPLPSVEGDGKPRHPSLLEIETEFRGGPLDQDQNTSEFDGQTTEELAPLPDYSNAQAFLEHEHAARVVQRLGLAKRHMRAPVEKLFPQNLKPGARLPANLDIR